MKNFWVRVTAESYEKAREIFVEQFTEVYMQDANKFSFQYTEEEFSPELFPGAEFAHIKQS